MAAHSYWRILTNSLTAGNQLLIVEIEMRAVAAGADQCTGGTAISDGSFLDLSRAFDNDYYEFTYTQTSSAIGSWIGYHFAAPVSVAEIRIRLNSSYVAGLPSSLSFQYSDNGTDWTTDTTITPISWTPSGFDAVDNLFTIGTLVNNYSIVGDVTISVLPQSVMTLQEYLTWVQRDSARSWTAIASSSNGVRLVAITTGDVYTSNDSGVTWTASTTLVQNSIGVSSSPSGIDLAVGSYNENILSLVVNSHNSGATWGYIEDFYKIFAISSSSDGTKLVATGGQDGFIYTSINSGTTWTIRKLNLQITSIASSSDGTKLVASVFNGYIYASVDSGVTWVEKESIRYWSDIASSSDGTKLVACVGNYSSKLANENIVFRYGYLYTSTDSGLTWTQRGQSEQWSSIASSSDGITLFAIESGGRIYKSTNSGVTWVLTGGYGTGWEAVAISGNSAKIFAASSYGRIYSTVDFGTTWSYSEGINYYWTDIASSNDGVKLAAINNGINSLITNGIYTSSDSGITWTLSLAGDYTWIVSSSDGTKLVAKSSSTIDVSTDSGATWSNVLSSAPNGIGIITAASSSDCSKLVAVDNYIYTSTDSGATWVRRDNIPNLLAIASSSDGTKLVCGGTGYLYTSIDSGLTWTQRGISSTWTGVASSSDGTKLSAVSNVLGIYTSTDSGVTWTLKFQHALNANLFLWTSISSSSDGVNLVAATIADKVYISTDSGATWQGYIQSGVLNKKISLSSNGEKLAVCGEVQDYIFTSGQPRLNGIMTSIDYGVTWSQITSDFYSPFENAPIVNDVKISADGSKFAAIFANTFASSSYLHISADNGATWSVSNEFSVLYGFKAISISSDGAKIALSIQKRSFLTSADYGATIALQAGGDFNLATSNTSTDGTKKIARGDRRLYTSIDSGFTWNVVGSIANWSDADLSSDGTKLIGSVTNGNLYTSIDSGVTWTARENVRNWSGVASSSNGVRLVACVDGGYTYKSIDSGETWSLFSLSTGSKNWKGITSSNGGDKIAAVADYIYTFASYSLFEETTTSIVQVSSSFLSSSIYNETTTSIVDVSSEVQYGKGNVLAIAQNTQNKAISVYNNFDFDGSCVFKGKTLLIKDTGLFQYGGNFDNGEYIDASIKTGKIDYVMGKSGLVSTQQNKVIPTSNIYLGLEKIGGSVDLNVTVDSETFNYNDDIEREGFGINKIKVGRGIKYNKIQLEVASNNCDTLNIESIEFEPEIIRRRNTRGEGK